MGIFDIVVGVMIVLLLIGGLYSCSERDDIEETINRTGYDMTSEEYECMTFCGGENDSNSSYIFYESRPFVQADCICG